MSLFDFHKPAVSHTHRDKVAVLRETLARLEATPNATPRIAELKQILVSRIREIESKST